MCSSTAALRAEEGCWLGWKTQHAVAVPELTAVQPHLLKAMGDLADPTLSLKIIES